MGKNKGKAKKTGCGLLTALCSLLIIMFYSVRWILAQKPEFYWLSRSAAGTVSYLIGCAGFVILSFFVIKTAGRLKHEQIFIILYLALGTAYMIVSPLSAIPDENEHMLRTYGITIGDFVPPVNEEGEGGSYAPGNLMFMWDRSGARLQYMRDNLLMEASPEKTFQVYSNTAFYSPLTYLPQAAGVLIARLICNKPYVIAYAGRLCELIASGVLIYLAIRLMPFGKNILLLLSLLPMNMYECASLSGDGMAYAVTLLIIAYSLWLRYEKKGRMSAKEILWLYILLALVASCKIVYAPFVLMAFVIPMERLGERKQYALHIICAGIMIILLAVGWPIFIGSRYLLEYMEGVSASAQTMYVITHPWSFLQVMIYTLIQEGEWLFKTYFGLSLSYFNVDCNILILFISAGSLIYACCFERIYKCEDEGALKFWKRPSFILGAATVLSIVFTFLSLYIEWTPYRAPSVLGLQGRYFIPLTFQTVYLLKRKYDNNREGADTQNGAEAGVYGEKPEIMTLPAVCMCAANLMVLVTLFVFYV
jgi:uncharacterized membrane protein